jgi:hypothetical protein
MPTIYAGRLGHFADSMTRTDLYFLHGRRAIGHFFCVTDYHGVYEVVRLRCQTLGTEEWSARPEWT